MLGSIKIVVGGLLLGGAAALIVGPWLLRPSDRVGGAIVIIAFVGLPALYLLHAGWRDWRFRRLPPQERARIAADIAARADALRQTHQEREHLRQTHICAHCGALTAPVPRRRGHTAVAALLWCCALLPGFLYSLWQANSQYDACAVCGAGDLVPRHTPRGRALEAEYPA